MTDTKIPLDTGDFRLMTARMARLLVSMPERDRFLRGMVSWAGFKQVPYDYDRDEDQLGWIPYPELLIDCWDTESVTVAGSVPARRAPLFEDGTRPFPRAALRSAGATDRELERLADARPVREPLDVAFGRERHRIAELPPDELVQVTWRATVAELIGEPYVALFKGLRRYGPDEELRILHKRG